jgi:hypothetical protein
MSFGSMVKAQNHYTQQAQFKHSIFELLVSQSFFEKQRIGDLGAA